MKAKQRVKKSAKRSAAKASTRRAGGRSQAKSPDRRRLQVLKQRPRNSKAVVAVKSQPKTAALKEPIAKEPALVMAPVDGKPLAPPDPDAGMMAGVKMATIPV